MNRLLCFIIGHSYGFFEINWYKEDTINVKCKCPRCHKILGSINHTRPYNWDELPF